jgi:hypothetical protein
MTRPLKSNNARTPLLFVLLGAAVLVTATSYATAHITIANDVLEPVVAAALVAVTGFMR